MAKKRIRCYSLIGPGALTLSKQKKKERWLTRKNTKRLLKIAFSMADLILKLVLVVEKIKGLWK